MELEREVEARLGQALVAFGQGSGAVNMRSDAAAKFRDTFLKPFRDFLQRDPKKFHDLFPHVLDVFRTLGMLSANFATAEGASCVECSHFDRAFQIVKAHEESAAGGRTDFC
jgi:hypothetical protein